MSDAKRNLETALNNYIEAEVGGVQRDNATLLDKLKTAQLRITASINSAQQLVDSLQELHAALEHADQQTEMFSRSLSSSRDSSEHGPSLRTKGYDAPTERKPFTEPARQYHAHSCGCGCSAR